MQPPKSSILQLVAGLALLIIVLAVPTTGWLARLQLKALGVQPISLRGLMFDLGVQSPDAQPVPVKMSERRRQLVENRPDDYGVQLAAELERATPQDLTSRLRALARRFPSKPGLLAHILRYDSKSFGTYRDEGYLLTGTQVPATRYGKPPTPEQIAAFERVAAVGERLDPDNAFFPMMRAVSHFAARQDDRALAALERAAGKSKWQDYVAEEAESKWRLHDEVRGRQSAVQRVAVGAAILFPHYSRLREAARLAAYKAVLLEKAGNAVAGLRIRRSLMRCGELMRAESPTLIGSLVGIAITAIGTTRAGGVPVKQRPSNVTVDEWNRERLNGFTRYAMRYGRTQDVGFAGLTHAAGTQSKMISGKMLDYSPLGGGPMIYLAILWAAGLILIFNALWMIMMGGCAAVLMRVRARTWVVAVLMAAGLLLLGAVSATLSQWVSAIAGMTSVIYALTPDAANPVPISPTLTRFIAAGAALLLPLVAVIIAGAWAGSRRRPWAETLTRTLATAGLILSIAYTTVLGMTVSHEVQVSDGIQKSLRGEGPYLAGLMGRRWPPRVQYRP